MLYCICVKRDSSHNRVGELIKEYGFFHGDYRIRYHYKFYDNYRGVIEPEDPMYWEDFRGVNILKGMEQVRYTVPSFILYIHQRQAVTGLICVQLKWVTIRQYGLCCTDKRKRFGHRVVS